MYDLIHTDLVECMTKGVKSYCVTFIGDFSWYTNIYLISNKNEVFDMFLMYKAEIENRLNKKIIRFRSNKGGEYTFLNDFCEREGIIHEVTPPYSPKSNGVTDWIWFG